MRQITRGQEYRVSSLLPVQDFAGAGAAALRLYIHSRPDNGSIYWRINGFRARLLVWTAEEWNKLDARPADAQFHPSGVWCALRLE
jgi:hypothetical protein